MSTSLIFIGTSTFVHNSAEYGGAICTYSTVNFTGSNNFINNSAIIGGVIYAHSDKYTTPGNVVLTFDGTNNFVNNSASSKGGAIHATANAFLKLRFASTSSFSYNTANFGGAIYTEYNVYLTFSGTNNFINNWAKYKHGGAIFTLHSAFSFSGTNNFTGNSAISDGGAVVAFTSKSLRFTGTTSFCNNSALTGGAIAAKYNSTLTFDGRISFTNNGNYRSKLNNGVSRGGALYLSISSTFSSLPHTTVHWVNNHANLGGAIYVSDVNSFLYCINIAPYIPREECFFQLPGQNMSNGIDIKLVFNNNSADVAGSVLYGGTIDNCKLPGLNSHSFGEVLDMLVHNNDTNYNPTSNISSEPLRICPCQHNHPDCSQFHAWYHSAPYPGETFQVSVVAVGQRDGTIPSTVRSAVRTSITDTHPINLLDHQYLKQINNTCTKLNYTVFSLS